MTETTRLLLVEDNTGDALLIRELLASAEDGSHFAIEHVTRHGDALARLAPGHGFDVVLHDLGLPDSQGLAPIERLSREHPELAIVVLTGTTDDRVGIDALKHGAQDYLVKGRVDPELLSRAIRYAQERRRTERALRASEKRHRELFEMSMGLICIHDLDGRLCTVNPAAAAMLEYRVEELEGRPLQDFVPADYQPAFLEYLAAMRATGEHRGLLVLRAQSGALRVLQYHNRAYTEPDGRRVVIGHAQDVTERRQYEQRLREMSFTDPLTGLYNRRYLMHREQSATPEQRFGAIVIDLDHFKQINDTYGHQRGDEVLTGIGQFLQRHARRGDAVVRMGGDEFLVLLKDVDLHEAEALAERIKADAASAPCGFSIGVAVREPGEPLEKTIDRADLTLYRIRVELRGYERRKHTGQEL